MRKQSQLANQVRKLQYQLSYSEHVNKELSEQLSALYQKTGVVPHKTRSNQNINTINTQTHLQELYYVQPLLLGYQHKINLLEQQIKSFEEESKDLHQFSTDIVNQNTFLRQELQTKNKYILKSQQIGINSNFLKLDNQNLKQKMDLIKQKNRFLQKKIKEMSEEQHKLKKKDRQLYTSDQMDKLMHDLKESNRSLEVEKIQLQKKANILENQLQNERAVLNESNRKTSQLESEIVRLKNQIKIIKQQLQTALSSHDSTSVNQQNQISSLKTQLNAAQRRESEMFNKNMVLESQLQDKNNKCHNLTLQNTQLQTNNNNLMQMLETYEVKTNDLDKKLRNQKAKNKEFNEDTMDYKKNNQLLEWKLAQKQRELQRKEIEWRKQKERVGKVWEDRNQAMRRALEQQRNQLNQQVQVLTTEKYKLELKIK